MVQLQEIDDEMANRLKSIQMEHGQNSEAPDSTPPTTTTQPSLADTTDNTTTSKNGPSPAAAGQPDLTDVMMSTFPSMPPARTTFGKKQTVDEVAAELKKSPFFMTELDENDETEAFKALAYEGTPLENAAEFKEQGNGCFKTKRWADAKEFYTKGILILAAEERKRRGLTLAGGALETPWALSADEQQQAVDEKWPEAARGGGEENNGDAVALANAVVSKQKQLLETLYGNRAACHLELRNYRSCWLDGAAALRLNDRNIKAYYRSARAFLAVDRIAEADDACAGGLAIDPDNAPLRAVARDIIKRSEEVSARQRREAEREAREARRATLLRAALKARGIPTRETAQPPEMEDAKVELTPDPDDPRSTLSFPTVLLYPVHLQSDFVKAFNEMQSVGDHLEYILPLPWDQKGEYTSAGVECYMETTAGGLIKVGKKLPLLKILSSGKVEVVDEVVKIFVVPKGEADAWVADFKSKKAAERGGP